MLEMVSPRNHPSHRSRTKVGRMKLVNNVHVKPGAFVILGHHDFVLLI